MKKDGKIKIVINTKNPTFRARLHGKSGEYTDSFNIEEPFDRKTHVFYVSREDAEEKLILTLTLTEKSRITLSSDIAADKVGFRDERELLSEYDNGLYPEKTEESRTVSKGVEYKHILYRDRKNAPVHVFTLTFSPEYARIYIGTPGDGYSGKKVKATIPDMISAAQAGGRKILGGVNADFFDIFGDLHPSGLCVKNGRVVANIDSDRPFAALLSDGSHVITSLRESPGILPRIVQAASGLQMIVRDGEIFDFAPLEPFSFVRHPRTAAGIRRDGTVILTVVDGRIPDYSNGTSLVDLGRLMLSFGADRAINLDGGGSSAIYTRQDGEFVLHSRPADLFRPTARLIRKDFNSILIEEK